MKKKIYYHVVMRTNSWVIKESREKNPNKVKNSVISYSVKHNAWKNINDPTSVNYGAVKRFINFIK